MVLVGGFKRTLRDLFATAEILGRSANYPFLAHGQVFLHPKAEKRSSTYPVQQTSPEATAGMKSSQLGSADFTTRAKIEISRGGDKQQARRWLQESQRERQHRSQVRGYADPAGVSAPSFRVPVVVV